jgi:hypothetical protein
VRQQVFRAAKGIKSHVFSNHNDRSEVPVAASRMTVIRPKVSMCRCEGSSPYELSFTRVRLRNNLGMSCDSIRSTAAKLVRKGMEMKLQMTGGINDNKVSTQCVSAQL